MKDSGRGGVHASAANLKDAICERDRLANKSTGKTSGQARLEDGPGALKEKIIAR